MHTVGFERWIYACSHPMSLRTVRLMRSWSKAIAAPWPQSGHAPCAHVPPVCKFEAKTNQAYLLMLHFA